MSGGPPPAGAGKAGRWWLLLGAIITVLVAGPIVALSVLFGNRGTEPLPLPPDPSPTTPSQRPAPRNPDSPVVVRAGSGALVPGVGQGQIYAQSATGIFRIDLGTGRVVRTATPPLEEHVTFVAGRNWVLVKSRWSPTGVIVRDGQPASPLPRRFDPPGFLHPGPGGRLWMEDESPTDPVPDRTIRLAELNGRLVPGRTITVRDTAAPYAIEPDGYGGILLSNRGGIYQLEPGAGGRARLITRGDLVGAGGRRLLVADCDRRASCRILLVDQRTRSRTVLPAAFQSLLATTRGDLNASDFGESHLSPDGTHLALTVGDGVHVVDLRTGRRAVLPGTVTDTNVNRQLSWSPNSRYLFALTDHRIRGFDTRTRTTRTVRITDEQLLHLTAFGTSGW